MIHGILNCDQLMEATGYDRPGDLCRSLEAQGVRYLKGKGGKPWTTLDLINAAAGLVTSSSSPADHPLSPDDV